MAERDRAIQRLIDQGLLPPEAMNDRPAACPYGQDGEAVCCGNPQVCGGPRCGQVWLDDGEAV